MNVEGRPMRVVFLYGPPGVGKLPVGTELAALTGFRLFHNHLTVDLVTAVFPRETDVWVRLLRRIQREVFTEATREGISLVYTGVYRNTAEQAAATQTMLEPVRAGGGPVLFVQLACAREELLVRVQSDSRRARGKLTDPQVRLDRYELFATMPFEPHLRLDTTHLPPASAAAQIAAHYSLPLA
jgi:hypothetical protein